MLQSFSTESWDVYDIGCGPGTFSLAWCSYFKKLDNINFKLIDLSEQMLEQAKILFDNFYSDVKVDYLTVPCVDSKLSLNSGKNKVIIFGHSINEMGIELASEWIRRIKPDVVVVIGPGTSTVFKILMEFRVGLLEDNFKVVYPCPGADPACPIANTESGDWCHQVVRQKHSLCIERLAQLVRVDRRSMPMIAHVYTSCVNLPFGKNGDHKIARIIQFLGENKAFLRWRLCRVSGDTEEVIFFEVSKRGLPKKEIKKLNSFQVGDNVELIDSIKIRDNIYRGKLLINI